MPLKQILWHHYWDIRISIVKCVLSYTKSVSSFSCTTGWKTRALRRIPNKQAESSVFANTRPTKYTKIWYCTQSTSTAKSPVNVTSILTLRFEVNSNYQYIFEMQIIYLHLSQPRKAKNKEQKKITHYNVIKIYMVKTEQLYICI